jgi:hypothetical protein
MLLARYAEYRAAVENWRNPAPHGWGVSQPWVLGDLEDCRLCNESELHDNMTTLASRWLNAGVFAVGLSTSSVPAQRRGPQSLA